MAGQSTNRKAQITPTPAHSHIPSPLQTSQGPFPLATPTLPTATTQQAKGGRAEEIVVSLSLDVSQSSHSMRNQHDIIG